jgi:hypothetical protein
VLVGVNCSSTPNVAIKVLHYLLRRLYNELGVVIGVMQTLGSNPEGPFSPEARGLAEVASMLP